MYFLICQISKTMRVVPNGSQISMNWGKPTIQRTSAKIL